MNVQKMEMNKEDLNSYAEKYIKPDMARSVDQKVLQLVVDFVIPQVRGPRVLEMGYGDGAWTGRVIEEFGQSHIVDASDDLLEVAKTRYGEKVSAFKSYFEIFVAPERFDSVICSYVLEHVVDPVTVLKQCKAWIKENGQIFIVVPNANSLHRQLAKVMGLADNVNELGKSDLSIGHRRVYDCDSMECDISAAGLAIESKQTLMCKPLPNANLASLSEAQLVGLFNLGSELPEELRGILVYHCC